MRISDPLGGFIYFLIFLIITLRLMYSGMTDSFITHILNKKTVALCIIGLILLLVLLN